MRGEGVFLLLRGTENLGAQWNSLHTDPGTVYQVRESEDG